MSAVALALAASQEKEALREQAFLDLAALPNEQHREVFARFTGFLQSEESLNHRPTPGKILEHLTSIIHRVKGGGV